MSENLHEDYSPEEERRQRIAELVTIAQDNLRFEQAALSSNENNESAISKDYQKTAKQAFDELMKLTYDNTLKLAWQRSGNRDDAEDIAQEAYLRAWRNLHKFQGDAEFTTWMFRITANEASTQTGRRSKHRERTVSIEEFEDPDYYFSSDGAASVEETIEAALHSEKVRKALISASAIGAVGLALLVGKYAYDRSHKELAEKHKLTEGAAKLRLFRAKRALAQLITRDGDLIE